MRKTLFVIAFLFICALPAAAQFGSSTASRLRKVAADSGTCSQGDVRFNTATNKGRVCGPDNTWADMSAGSSSGTVTTVSVVTANGVSGSVANASTTPAITVTLGAITPTTVNGLTITSSTGTFTLTNLKTFAVSNSLTLAGTDATVMTFPSTSATIARTDAANTFSGAQAFSTSVIIGAGSAITSSGAGGALGTNAFTSTAFATAARNVNTTSPITGGGDLSADRTIACATCTTNAAALTANQLVVGGGSQAAATLGSLGTTTTVLHGNAAGNPSFGAIVNGDITNATIAVGKLASVSGNGTMIGTVSGAQTSGKCLEWDANGNIAIAVSNAACGAAGGGGTVTATGGSLTANSVVLGAGTTDTKVIAGITTNGTAQLVLGVNTTSLGSVKMFGNTSGDATVQPAAAAGTSTVVTLPNASSTLPIFPQQMTFVGPTAPRTVTYPDANFTVARTDALNTFTGASSTTSWAETTPVITGGLTASGSGANTFAGSTGTFLTSTGPVTIGPGAVGISGIPTLTPPVRASGVASYFTLNIPADTGQTASTESIGYQHVTGTRTWATTGTVALQRENFFAGPTYASAGASQTFTDAFTLYASPPVAGSNAIFTRGHTLGIVDSTSAASSITGGLVVATTLGTSATSVGIGGGNVNAGGNGTFGGTLAVTGHTTFEGVTSTGATGTGKLVYDTAPTFTTSITDSGLTSGRVTFAGTAGILSDDADMTFLTDTLTVTKAATGRVVTAKTSNYTVLSGDVGQFFTNTGAGGAVVFTLPTAVVGMSYEFYRDANQTVQITAGSSTTIRIGTSITTSAGNVTLDAIGSKLVITAISTTQWVGHLVGAATFN